jgi:hypothetical protein
LDDKIMLGGGPQPLNIPEDQGSRAPIRHLEDEERRFKELRKKVFLWGGIILLVVLEIFLFMLAVGIGQYS